VTRLLVFLGRADSVSDRTQLPGRAKVATMVAIASPDRHADGDPFRRDAGHGTELRLAADGAST